MDEENARFKVQSEEIIRFYSFPEFVPFVSTSLVQQSSNCWCKRQYFGRMIPNPIAKMQV